MNRIKRFLIIGIIPLLLVFGCAGPAPIPSVQLTAEERARLELEQTGREYLKQAENATSPQKEELLLLAADYFARAHNISLSQRTLSQIEHPQRLSTELISRQSLVQAQILLVENNAFAALQLLNNLPDSALTGENSRLFYQRRANAYRQMGNYLAATRNLVWLAGLLEPSPKRDAIHAEIWDLLQNIPLQSLLSLQQHAYSLETQGWLELAYLYKLHREDQQQLNLATLRWQNQYPNHPISDPSQFVGEINLPKLEKYPKQIAVLVPLSGPLKRAGLAVKQGFLTAYYDSATIERPRISFYDTGSQIEGYQEAKAQALLEGAELIIGPLNRELVAFASQSEPTPVPMLALNYSQTTKEKTKNLIQFGLAPEDDARQVASLAWSQGHRSVLIITPSGEWGERISAAFDHHWRELGGQVLESQQFAEDASIAGSIRRLLNVDESEARHRELRQLLRRNLKFETRRRQDVDFIFVAAFPAQARQIQPLLRFYYAENLPVFATSHVYSGWSDPKADRDLNGIIFCDIPWILDGNNHRKETIKRLWPNDYRDYSRLFALGIDAYEMVPYLENLILYPSQFYEGQTGSLTLNKQNQIERQLQWAQFQRGRAVRMQSDVGTW